MDFDFPPDTLMLRDMLRRFVQKDARPLEMKFFTAGALEPEEQRRLRQAVEQMGLWGLTVPEEVGGGGLDLITTCMIEEELGKTFIPVEIGEVPLLLYASKDEQVARYLEPALAGERRAIIAVREPESNGSRSQTWTTTAAAQEEGYLLNGRKLLGVHPEPDDFLIVLAKDLNVQAPEALTAFFMEARDAQLTPLKNNLTLLELQNFQVSPQSVLGQPGEALKTGAAQAPREWIKTGARYLGIVERLIEMAAEHARDWVSLGAPLSVRPAIQRFLAEMQVDLESARWLVYHGAWAADMNPGKPLRSQAAQVRLATGEMLQGAIDRTTMVFAGPGPSPQVEFQRIVQRSVPPEVLKLALDQSRAIIAAEVLHLAKE